MEPYEFPKAVLWLVDPGGHGLHCSGSPSDSGIQEPVGFWGPFALSSTGDVSTHKQRRTVELRRGRLYMIAAMGYIAPEVTGKFPGYLRYSANLRLAGFPTGLPAFP